MKYWLITGISSGLGEALANAVMQTNDFVIGTFRNQEQVDQFNKKHPEKGYAILLDITNQKNIAEGINTIISKFGRIDVLVNNAGIGFIGAIEESSLEEVRSVFEANFFGTLQLTQAVLPHMRKAKNGNIIQISSHGGIKAFAGFGVYNASKFALEGFSEALAQEVAPLGIAVSIIEPGPFRTKFAGNNLREAHLEIDDYAETAGIFRQKLKSVDGKQEGNPTKAALEIITLTQTEKPTLRLPLGKTALTTIAMKIKSITEDLEANREKAENAVF